MKIQYIYLGSDTTFPNKDFWNTFCYNTRFISNWMSRKVRLKKISTDGTFNHISVYISPKEDKCKVDGKGIFLVPLHWIEEDIVQYLNMKDENERISLYLDLLREGLKKAAQIKEIHIIELLSIIQSHHFCVIIHHALPQTKKCTFTMYFINLWYSTRYNLQCIICLLKLMIIAQN